LPARSESAVGELFRNCTDDTESLFSRFPGSLGFQTHFEGNCFFQKKIERWNHLAASKAECLNPIFRVNLLVTSQEVVDLQAAATAAANKNC
jgi:hypothetical protein